MTSNTAMYRTRRDPLFGRTRTEFETALSTALEGRVISAWFFGSYGMPSFSDHSDIDVILVTETDLPFPLRNREFEDILDIVPSMDILVYTPDEFERLTHQPTAGFWRSVTAGMRRFI